jgi:hypothetical protein
LAEQGVKTIFFGRKVTLTALILFHHLLPELKLHGLSLTDGGQLLCLQVVLQGRMMEMTAQREERPPGNLEQEVLDTFLARSGLLPGLSLPGIDRNTEKVIRSRWLQHIEWHSTSQLSPVKG